MINIFGPSGRLASCLPSFEFRQGQLEMAEGVAGIIKSGGHLICEAGTGIGKGFAYLIPFIEWAISNDKRVVVATYTKALQEQLAKKDIPFLIKSLGFDFRYALCFGGENYLCRRRLNRSWQQGLFETKREAGELGEIMGWETETGLKMEMPFEPLDSVWLKVCRQKDLCRGKKCGNRHECFYARARAEQAKAHLLIANHHLFFADIASGILPEYDGVVFDEAHNLEDVAASHFGFELTNTQLKYMLDEFFNPRHGTGFFSRTKGLKGKGDLVVMANAARQAGDIFFSRALELMNGRTSLRLGISPSPLACPEQSRRVGEGGGEGASSGLLENSLSSTLEQMADAVQDKIKDIDDEGDREEVACHILRLKGFAAEASDFVEQKRKGHVYWIEAESKQRMIKCRLCASPVDVAPYLKEFVFDQISPIVLTSATMAVGDRFDFIKNRLGIESPSEILLPSPFDFERQTLFYAPSDLPDPSRNEDLYVEEISKRIKNILKITGGRAFILFTSYQMLNRVHDLIADDDFLILMQGELPRWQLLQKFKKMERAVLLGTATFWQGIDVPGSALECVIITRLPFAVPDHPLTQARLADLEGRGEDAFMGYQVPKAALLLKQGFGRLIRHRNDIGIVAIMDPRIRTRHYGRVFLDALPRCREVASIDALEAAYKELKSHFFHPENLVECRKGTDL